MKISGNEIKLGMIIEHNNDLWEVLKTQHVKPGKGGAFNQVEFKSINNGTKLNERFRSSDTVERVILEEKKYDFLHFSLYLRARGSARAANFLCKCILLIKEILFAP